MHKVKRRTVATLTAAVCWLDVDGARCVECDCAWSAASGKLDVAAVKSIHGGGTSSVSVEA